MSELPDDDRGDNRYKPDPFSVPKSGDDLRSQVQALGCVLVAAFPLVIFGAEILRGLTSTTWWWGLLVRLLGLATALWVLWRFWQNPALLDRALPNVAHDRRRRSVIWLGMAIIALASLELYGHDIILWLDGW